jgi:hypothetical protein
VRYLPGLILCLLVEPACVFADITCTPTRALPQQNRTQMKHRNPPAQSSGPTLITVQQVVAEAPASGISQPGFKSHDAPLDPRESQVVTLKGDLWLAKIESNDCDLHLEISGVGGSQSDDRIIVEIPQGPQFLAARNALLQALAARKVKLSDKPLKQSIPMQVLGFMFFDAWHFSAGNPRGHSHGSAEVATLWEIHPVYGIVFPQN